MGAATILEAPRWRFRGWGENCGKVGDGERGELLPRGVGWVHEAVGVSVRHSRAGRDGGTDAPVVKTKWCQRNTKLRILGRNHDGGEYVVACGVAGASKC